MVPHRRRARVGVDREARLRLDAKLAPFDAPPVNDQSIDRLLGILDRHARVRRLERTPITDLPARLRVEGRLVDHDLDRIALARRAGAAPVHEQRSDR
jgi:hypothetical protein